MSSRRPKVELLRQRKNEMAVEDQLDVLRKAQKMAEAGELERLMVIVEPHEVMPEMYATNSNILGMLGMLSWVTGLVQEMHMHDWPEDEDDPGDDAAPED